MGDARSIEAIERRRATPVEGRASSDGYPGVRRGTGRRQRGGRLFGVRPAPLGFHTLDTVVLLVGAVVVTVWLIWQTFQCWPPHRNV